MSALGTAAGARKFPTIGKGKPTFIAERGLNDQPLRRPDTLGDVLQVPDDLFLCGV